MRVTGEAVTVIDSSGADLDMDRTSVTAAVVRMDDAAVVQVNVPLSKTELVVVIAVEMDPDLTTATALRERGTRAPMTRT